MIPEPALTQIANAFFKGDKLACQKSFKPINQANRAVERATAMRKAIAFTGRPSLAPARRSQIFNALEEAAEFRRQAAKAVQS